MLKSRNRLFELKRIYIKMVVLILLFSVISLFVVLLIGKDFINSYLNDDKIYGIIIKATGLLFFYCITLFNTEVLRALERVYIAELYRNTFKYTSVIIGSIILFYIHKETYLVDTFLIGFFFLSLFTSIKIYAIFNTTHSFGSIQDHEAIVSYKSIFNKSYPIAISTLAIFLLMSFDVLFLKKFKGNEAVAFYALAVKLMSLLLVVMNSVNITISPKIAEQFYSKNKNDLIKTMRNSARLIVMISIPTVFTFCLFSSQILSFFGEKYTSVKEPLIILMVGQGICSLFGSVQVYLNMTGRQNIFQFILVLAVILNFTLNRSLIPIYGMNGAAFSYVISMFFWNLIATIVIYKKDKIPVFLN
jgi:O-antigen/teichoic acid export membrane protein